MWKTNPNPSKWKAAVCYNMAYDINDRSKISSSGYDVDNGKVADVNLKSGVLHTELVFSRAISIQKILTKISYDCCYVASGGRFIVKGDGGFINVRKQFLRF